MTTTLFNIGKIVRHTYIYLDMFVVPIVVNVSAKRTILKNIGYSRLISRH